MKMQQVSDHCFAVLNETNRVCDANSGLINLAEGVLIDTQSDLLHARQMIGLFSSVWSAMPRYVVLTHEDLDHVAGNQLFPGAEIIAHRTVAERMKHTADPSESQKLQHAVADPATRTMLETAQPGLLAVASQLQEDFDFDGIELVLPTTVFEDRHVLDLGGTRGPPDLCWALPPDRRRDRARTPRECPVYRRLALQSVDADGLGWFLPEFLRRARSDRRPGPRNDRPRAWAGLRDRRGQG